MQQHTGIPFSKVQEIIGISQIPLSLETPIGDEDGNYLGDFVEDQTMESLDDSTDRDILRTGLNAVLDDLTEREQRVIRLRFGIDDGKARTLEEVGNLFDVTRERIRQIEAKALKKTSASKPNEKTKRIWHCIVIMLNNGSPDFVGGRAFLIDLIDDLNYIIEGPIAQLVRASGS